MPSSKPKSNGIWGLIKIGGIIVAVAGFLIATYSVFMLGSAPHGFEASGFNRTGTPGGAGFNHTASNVTGTSRFGRVTGFVGGTSGVVIGILALLLGVVTYKYSQLKIAVMSKK